MFELSKQFRFDAAHSLECQVNTETNRRIHGHSYRAEVTVRGEERDGRSGMLIDLGHLEKLLKDVQQLLDHRMLNEVEGLGPATLENLSAWIWQRLAPDMKGLAKVAVYRDSNGDSCIYYGPKTV